MTVKNKVQDLGPLDWRMSIVDRGGRPTPEFQRRWETQRSNNSLITSITVGVGPPTGASGADGNGYINISSSPPSFYISSSNHWVKVGVYSFTQLSDVPSTYAGAGGQIVQVNPGATGLIFTNLSGILDSLGAAQGDILYRGASGWTTLAPSTAGYVLSTGGPGANPSWIVSSGGGGGTVPNGMLPLVNGDTPGPSAISDGNGQYIGVPL